MYISCTNVHVLQQLFTFRHTTAGEGGRHDGGPFFAVDSWGRKAEIYEHRGRYVPYSMLANTSGRLIDRLKYLRQKRGGGSAFYETGRTLQCPQTDHTPQTHPPLPSYEQRKFNQHCSCCTSAGSGDIYHDVLS